MILSTDLSISDNSHLYKNKVPVFKAQDLLLIHCTVFATLEYYCDNVNETLLAMPLLNVEYYSPDPPLFKYIPSLVLEVYRACVQSNINPPPTSYHRCLRHGGGYTYFWTMWLHVVRVASYYDCYVLTQ